MNSRAVLYEIAVGLASFGCTNDVVVGRLGRSSIESQVDGSPSTTGDASTAACTEVRCRGPVLQCGDCLDNDGDGLVDAADPECFGPCSDSEATYAGRLQACQATSCFFDLDCGEGNDEVCLDLVPNGCDCHGCCELGGRTILLGSVDEAGNATCSAAAIDDPDACSDCTVDEGCFNPCGECETCFASDGPSSSCPLVDECRIPQCAEGIDSCATECELACPEGVACITGCCVETRSSR